MNDGIIMETGNSRFLKSIAGFLQAYPTYEDFAAALVAGTLPVDFNGLNADGWATLGTLLNKANLLTDATAALEGLGSEATPNEMFAARANKLNGLITCGTIDLTAGSSDLATGRVYLVYK